MLGSGDIASCGQDWDEATARMLDTLPGTVITLGDNAYAVGSPDEYNDCYAPTWGRHRNRTRPAPGNHDYYTAGGAGYYGYFGARAGDPARGYYSYDLGRWHVVVLNSAWREGGPSVADTSAQLAWLRNDLAAHPALCTLVYWHHPRFSSGTRSGDNSLDALWRVLYPAGVDLVLNGHDHFYERFAPQDPDGAPDPANGVRQITAGMAGTGATGGYSFGTPLPTSEMRQNIAAGIVRLSLDSASYRWEFLPAAGFSFTDSGTSPCH